MSKGARNRDHRRNGSSRPPTAGAVDLEQLRKRPDTAERLAEAERDILDRQGLVCPCGERVRDEGVEYMALVPTNIPTPAGPEATIVLGSTTFHSIDCPALGQLLAHARDERGPADPRPIVLRAAPAVVWIDELTAAEA